MSSDFMQKNECAAEQLQPGDVISVTISGYTHQGCGVARHNGRVIFVPGALREEQVQVEILRWRKGIFYGELRDILQPSPQRRQPICPVFEQCGGCQLQHMSYEEELAFKREQVQAALQRIGGLSAEVRPPVGATEQGLFHYRNKGVFHVSRERGGVQLGFWDEASHQPAGAACRLLFPEPLQPLLSRLQQADLPGAVRDVLLRFSFAEGKIMLFLRPQAGSTKQQLGECRSFLQQLSQEFAELLVWGLQLAEGWEILSPEKYLLDALADVRYQIGLEAFFQVNNAQTLRLLQVVQQALAQDTRVLLDAYCGIGTLGLWLAKGLPNLQRLLGIELNREAVMNARQNARLNGLTKADFWQGKAEAEFAKVLQQGWRPDAVIVDPPRRGCHQQLLAGLLDLAPRQLVYVSCNPATLARDLQLLCGKKYALQLVQPVDMFPRTHHVETVCVLSRI